jgi:pyroglutamyl-peptidase
MRLLIYGFGPYRQFRENVTAKILKLLPKRANLKTVVFPVRFYRKQFIEAIERHRPDDILGLGQSSRRRIEIETRAANRRRANRKARPRSIAVRGPRWLPTTLPLKLGRAARESRNAGDYVCNYSMYVMLNHLRKTRRRMRYGFVHVPFNRDPRAAARLIERAIGKWMR